MHVAHRVRQPGQLPLPGFDDARVGVAGGGDAKRGGQIEIFFAVGVPDIDIPGAFPDNRPRAVRFNDGRCCAIRNRAAIEESLLWSRIYDFGFTIYAPVRT